MRRSLLRLFRLRNIPNIISGFRLLLVPVFLLFYFSGLPQAHLLAGITFVVAALSDMLDGYIARRFGFITPLGHVLDPLADKCMQCTAAICLGIDGIIPMWIAYCLIAKETLLLIGGTVIFRRFADCIPSNIFGKAVSALIFFLVSFYTVFPDVYRAGAPWFFAIAVILSIPALVIYTVRGVRLLRSGSDPDAGISNRPANGHNTPEVN